MDDSFSIGNRVYDLKPFICKVIRGPSVLQHLLFYTSPADATDIKKAYDRMHHERATNLLLDKLIESPHTGKWQAFVEALENSEYPYLVSLLKDKDENPEDYRHQKIVIQIFAPYLSSIVEPLSLLCRLKNAGLINTMDEQEIFSCANSEGATAATMLMLDRIQCRQSPSKWFLEFLKILYFNGHEGIVMEMEPDFTIDCTVLKQNNDVTGNKDMELNVSEESLTEYIIEARLDNFRQEIIELVSVQKITANLSHYLLPIHYAYIAGILTRTCEKSTYYRERNLIKIFTPTLQHQLEPGELIVHLLADDVINDIDKDEILLKYRCSGSIAASIALLDCMQCRLSPDDWYFSFLNALIKCGRNYLVYMVDPDFLDRSECKDEILDEVQEPLSIPSSNIHLKYAFARVLEMERSAKQVVAKLRQKYEEMEIEALMEIKNESAKLIDTLLETNENIQSKASNNYQSHMDIEILLDEILDSFDRKEFKFVPEKYFLSLQKLGSIYQSTRRHRRSPRIFRDRSQSPCIAYRDRGHRHFRHRSSSSGSTQSSGFVHITGIDEISTHFRIDQHTLPSNISGQNSMYRQTQDYCLAKNYRGSVSLTRQESVSSTYTDSLSLTSSEDISTSAGLVMTETSESPDIDAIRRFESFVNFICYRTINVPGKLRKDYQLSSLCILPTNELAMIDLNHSSVIFFDPNHTNLKTYKMKKSFPVRVGCCENGNVFVLYSRSTCKSIIVMYEPQYLWTRSGKRLLSNLVPVKKLQHACGGQICSMSCSGDKVFTVCCNGHIHNSTDEGVEEKVTHVKYAKIKTNLIWPQFCTSDKDSYAIFIYDVYSSSVGKYIINNGKCVWTVTVEKGEIDDLIACFGRLFISQNKNNAITIIRQDSGEVDHFFLSKENVSFPFGLASNRYQSTMLVSSYNHKRKRGNNIIRYF